MLRASEHELQARAERLAAAFPASRDRRGAIAKVGGGALPLLELEGPGRRARPDGSCASCAPGDPPVVGRVAEGRLLLDPRTLTDEEVGWLGGRHLSAPLTLGTAGHIDHGKTALVAALTGRDTDRLPEERERGISIALGYAPLTLPSGRTLSLVDVPGHERFVRTMVAGATGIDLCLLVVAADDGVMPQTREHLAVLRALGVDERRRRRDQDRPRRSRAGDRGDRRARAGRAGRARLRADRGGARRRCAPRSTTPPPRTAEPRRAPTGRRACTSTGSSPSAAPGRWSPGRCGAAASRAATASCSSPRAGEARVRGVQVHDAPVERAAAGQRVALNLAGVDRDEVERGDVVTRPSAGLAVAHILDVALDFASPPEDGRARAGPPRHPRDAGPDRRARRTTGSCASSSRSSRPAATAS